ncbi:hypothetical protein POM88_033071 [Heracleum sosnowskyi]|uniref:Uncharacterized protein n=1 Tax=Heracleum sosnowskyi TaxID=360622 RepID=A0AAD8MLX3_9APIA|nr:hypothetical protein POM88_033071 [Heracleum sosnowskyi]
MATQQVNKILESNEKDLVMLIYLARNVFQRRKQRQWWLANSEFTEHDLDLIVSTADLFQPAKKLDKSRRAHLNFCSRELSPNDPGLRNLVKKIRDSAAFWKSSSNGHRPKQLAYDRYRVHQRRYFSYSDKQIAGADSAVTYSGLRDLVKRIRGSAAFRESLGITEVSPKNRSQFIMV